MGWCFGPVDSCSHTKLERADFCASDSNVYSFHLEERERTFKLRQRRRLCSHLPSLNAHPNSRLSPIVLSSFFFLVNIEIRHTTGNILTTANRHGLTFVKALACEPLFHRQWLTDFNSCYCINILPG